MQVISESADEGVFAEGAGEQTPVWGQRIEGAEEAEPLHEGTNGRVHRDHPFGFQLSEGDQDSPLSGSSGMEAIQGQIGHFADPHSGVAKQ
jgi:hypothetical protein